MAPDCMSDTPDVVYDPLRTYNNEFPTLASHMENSPVRYAVMKCASHLTAGTTLLLCPE